MNELIDHRRWHHDPRDNLLRLLHSEQKIHDEFMLPLQHNSTGRENSAGDMRWHKCPDMRVTDLLALRAFVV